MKNISEKKEVIILSLILLAGLVLRLWDYAAFSLTNDELSALYRTNYNSLHDLIAQGVGIDYHPAGVQVFLYYWVKIFGNSEVALRFPFVIAGTLSILFTYLFSRRWFNANAALLAAAFVAFLPFPVIYSQIARPYASGIMLSGLLAWLWSIVLRPKENEQKHIFFWSIALAFAFAFNLYNHYFSGLLAFIIGISGLSLLNRKNLLPYLLALFLASLLFLPHIPMTLHHLAKGGLSTWLGKPDPDWPLEHLALVFRSLFVVVLIIAAIGQSYYNKRTEKSKAALPIRILLALFFLLPFLTGFFYSLLVNPVLQHSILIFSLPFLLVWITSFVPENLKTSYLLTGIALIFVLQFLPEPTSKQPLISKQDFKEIAHVLKKWQQEFPADRTIRFMESNSPDYIKYYLKEDSTNIRFAQWKFRNDADLQRLKNILDTTSAVYLHYTILTTDNPLALNMMHNRFPKVIQHHYLAANTRAILLARGEYSPLYPLSNNPLAHYATPADSSIILDSLPYSKGLQYTFNEIDKPLPLYLQASIDINKFQANTAIKMVIQISDKNGNNSYWNGVPLHYFLNTDSVQEVRISYILPQAGPETKELKVYLWNPNLEEFRYKNLKMELGEITLKTAVQ
jgi:uncharacterized membrane protein